MTFATTAEVYGRGAESTYSRRTTPHDRLRAFVDASRSFARELGDERQDGFWRDALRSITRLRFDLMSAPLPLNDPNLKVLETVVRLRAHARESKVHYKDYYESYRSVIDALAALIGCDDDPLTALVQEITGDERSLRTCVVLSSSRLEDATRIWLRGSKQLELDVLTPPGVLTRRPYDRMILVGSTYWYANNNASWLLTAPRASSIDVISYDWVRDPGPPQAQVFANSVMGRSPVRAAWSAPAEASADNDLLPQIDWQAISDSFLSRNGSWTPAEAVDARLLLLADNHAAFVTASQEAIANVFLPGEAEGERIGTVDADELVPGMYILLRSEGGGDYIVTIADRILADGAEPLRKMQRAWKSLLREAIERDGIDAVMSGLTTLGSQRANRQNVRNWAAPRSLRTDREEDFTAIMRYVGLGDAQPAYWAAMHKLAEAHRKAGLYIRSLLNAQAGAADPAVLEETGRLDFTIPEQDGGTLTAFRVEEIAAEEYTVPATRLGEPFALEDDAWHG